MEDYIEKQRIHIQEKISNAEDWYFKQQKIQIPLLEKEIKEKKLSLQKLEENLLLPLSFLIPTKIKIQNQIETLQRQLFKFQTPNLIQEFKQGADLSTVFQNNGDTMKRAMEQNNNNKRTKKQKLNPPSDVQQKSALGVWSKLKNNQITTMEDEAIIIEDEKHIESEISMSQEGNELMNAYLKEKEHEKMEKSKLIISKLKSVRLNDDEFIMDEEEFKMKQNHSRISELKQFCYRCKQPLFAFSSESKLVCKNSKCGMTQEFIDMSAATISYMNGGNESNENTAQYEKCGYFMEVLEIFRPRELQNKIHHSVYDDIKSLMRKNRFLSPSPPSVSKIQTYLQYLNYSNLYDYKYQILFEMTGISVPIMKKEEELKILFAFLQLQPIFEVVKEDNNNNNGSANIELDSEKNAMKYKLYCYYICRMNKFDHFCPHLSLNQIETLRKQINRFNLMMKKLDLDFIAQLY